MNSCSQICVNTDGSYECDCQRGYRLSGDGQTCEGGWVGGWVGVQGAWDLNHLFMNNNSQGVLLGTKTENKNHNTKETNVTGKAAVPLLQCWRLSKWDIRNSGL